MKRVYLEILEVSYIDGNNSDNVVTEVEFLESGKGEDRGGNLGEAVKGEIHGFQELQPCQTLGDAPAQVLLYSENTSEYRISLESRSITNSD